MLIGKITINRTPQIDPEELEKIIKDEKDKSFSAQITLVLKKAVNSMKQARANGTGPKNV